MNKKHIIVSVIVLIIVAVGFYYLGKSSSASAATKTATTAGLGQRRQFTGGAGGVAAAGGFTSGQIISKDDTTFTIQLPNNAGSKIVFYSPSTTITKMTVGTAQDLSVGSQISITGTANSDGSITAQMVQLRPAGMGQAKSQTSGSTQTQ